MGGFCRCGVYVRYWGKCIRLMGKYIRGRGGFGTRPYGTDVANGDYVANNPPITPAQKTSPGTPRK